MECSAELSAATMYLYKMTTYLPAFLIVSFVFVSLIAIGVCILAAINESLKKYVDLKYQIEKDKFGSP